MHPSITLNSALIILSLLTLTLIMMKSPSLTTTPLTSTSYQDLNNTLTQDLTTLTKYCGSNHSNNSTKDRTLVKESTSTEGASASASGTLGSGGISPGFLKAYFSDSSKDSVNPVKDELALVQLTRLYNTFKLSKQQQQSILSSITSYNFLDDKNYDDDVYDQSDLVKNNFFFVGDFRFRDALYQIIAYPSTAVATPDEFIIKTITNTTQTLLLLQQDEDEDEGEMESKCLILQYLIRDVELKQVKKKLKTPNLKVKKSAYFNNEQCTYTIKMKLRDSPTTTNTNSPQIHYTATLSSPDCQIKLRSSSVLFTSRETLVRSELDSAFLLLSLSLLELYATIVQLQKAESPIARARISQTSVLIMASLDFCIGALCFIRCFFDPTTDGDVFESLCTLAFVKLVEFAFYDMKLVFSVAKAQARERVSWPTKLKYYLCFLLGFYCGFVLVSEWFIWTLELLIVFLYSFWVPQIIRNVYQNSRASICWEFLVGGTLFRVIAGLFLWVCVFKSGGYPFYPRDCLQWPRLFLLVAIVISSSLLLLITQMWFGSRSIASFLPLPYSYNYHRIASHDTECAICFNHIKREGKGEDVGELMQTPCGHLFDTGCLERWIETKLECPVCRAVIPEYN